MKIVVISKDQPKYISDFENALSEFEHIYVIDRPTVKYPEDIPAIYNYYGEGFLAGRMRDLGAINFPDDDILFLDGDKVPSGNLKLLDSLPYDCVLLGVDSDPREYFDGSSHEIKLPADPRFQINGCYSCGILYRKNLIRRFREINQGRIFHPIFDGTWGDEDSWNGDIINYEKFKIGVTSDIILGGEIGGCKINKNYIPASDINFAFSDPLNFVQSNTDYRKLLELFTNFKKRLQLRKFHYGIE